MALPPKEMHTTCLRCKRALDDGERICPGCGADREVELAVAAELNPAVASLQRWLAVLAGLQLLLGGLMYEHFNGKIPDGEMWALTLPPLIIAAILLVLLAFARMAPFVVPLIALCLFGGAFAIAAVTDPAGTLSPGIGLAIRVMFMIVLVGAVQSGWRARSIRQRAGRPRGLVTGQHREE